MQYVQLWKDKERKEASEYETSLKQGEREEKKLFQRRDDLHDYKEKKRKPREKENTFGI